MSEALAMTAQVWQPDWAGVMSESSMLARNFDAEEPFVDWMVYTPRKVEDVPQPSFVIDLQENGSLVVVDSVPPSTERRESLALIKGVENALKHAH
jgi:hypothetical protein